MPSLHIPSLFQRRQQKYGEPLTRVRRELADFLDSFEAQVGKEVAGVLRAYAAIPRKYFVNDDEPPAEKHDVFTEVRQLVGKDAMLFRKGCGVQVRVN